MLTDTLDVTVEHVQAVTGWQLKPEGACKDVRCVPLPAGVRHGDRVRLDRFAETMRMPLLHDEERGLWSLGPPAGGHALASAHVPDVVLPTLDGEPFPLSRLRGTKVLIAAWASW